MSTVKTNIAAGLKKARKNAGMSVDQVGAAIGKSGKTISAWEVGRGQPDGDELIVLCRLLGVHLRDFYGEEYDGLFDDSDKLESLSNDEKAIIDIYRKCNPIGQSSIEKFAQAAALEFPVDGITFTLSINSELSDEERERNLRNMCQQALDNGMTEDELIKTLNSLTDLIGSKKIHDLPKINATQLIVDRMNSEKENEFYVIEDDSDEEALS